MSDRLWHFRWLPHGEPWVGTSDGTPADIERVERAFQEDASRYRPIDILTPEGRALIDKHKDDQ